MKLFRHHPYLISFALMLAVLPIPALAIGEDLIHSLVVSVFGLFVWLSALILEFALNHFVLGFGETFTKTGIGVAVDQTWIIIRDFVNMFFIFGFVYIGFKMILNSNDSNTRRWLVNLLLAALLVNFSLFATKFVVDVSNQLAAQIAFGGLSSMQTTKPDGSVQLNLSKELMVRMGVQGALGGTKALPKDAGYQYIFGTAILFLVTTFVFAAGGILLIIRFAVLNFFLMLSPVMFIGWVLPIVKRDFMGEYWSKFIGKAFFAPIYLLFIYFSFRVMDGLQVAVGSNSARLANPDWAGTFQKIEPGANGAVSVTSSALGTVPFFILICTFMILSLIMAQKLGATGGDRAVALGKTLSNKVQRGVTRTAGGATFGLAARAGQATVGAGANAAANSRSFQGLAANNKLARYALQGTRKVADASFDARRVGGLGKELGLGEGVKGGFATRIKNRNKRDEEFVKSLDDADMDDPENIRRAEDRAREIRIEGERQKQTADAASLAYEESKDKTSVVLEREIDELGNNIAILTRELDEQTKNGTRTPQELAAAQRRLEDQKARQQQKFIVRDAVKAKEIRQKEIEELRKQEVNPTVSAENRAIVRERRQEAEKELEAIDEGLNKQASKLKTEIERAEKQIKTAGEVGTAEIKFANKISFMRNLEQKSKRSFTPLEKESLSNLKKKFGKDPAEMADKAAKSKAEKELAKRLKEIEEENSDGGEKKDEPKKEGS
jgi:hypothetical protein